MGLYTIIKTLSQDLYDSSGNFKETLNGAGNYWRKRYSTRISSGTYPSTWDTQQLIAGDDNKYIGKFEFTIPNNTYNTNTLSHAIIRVILGDGNSTPANCRCYLLSGSPTPAESFAAAPNAISVGRFYSDASCSDSSLITDTNAIYKNTSIYTKIDLSSCSKGSTYTACFLENINDLSPKGYLYGTTTSGSEETITIYTRDLYTITLNTNGGQFSDNTQQCNISVILNGSTNKYISQLTPSRVGHAFDGWYDSNGAQVYDKNGSAIVGTYWDSNKNWKYTNDVTLYAHWTINVYTITYSPGEYGKGETYSVETEHAAAITLPGAIFTRFGYAQIGWINEASGNWYSLNQSFIDGEGFGWHTTLTPRWEKNQSEVNLIINSKPIQGTSYVFVRGKYNQGVVYVKTPNGYKTLYN